MAKYRLAFLACIAVIAIAYFLPKQYVSTVTMEVKPDNSGAKDRRPVRVAVIGGMTMTGMWDKLVAQFEADTGWKTQLVITGPKDVISAPFKQGEVDVLTMHTADKTTDLVADGYGVNMRPWARNEHTIVGPASDPAGIRGMKDGAAALKKIAEAHAPFVDFYGPGSRELTHKLWQRAGLKPEGDWVLKDESNSPQEIVAFAEKKQAYVVVGRIPVTNGKMPVGKGHDLLRRVALILSLIHI